MMSENTNLNYTGSNLDNAISRWNDYMNKTFHGQDGYTPQRGTDYWTTSDIATLREYINDTLSALVPSVVFDSEYGVLTITGNIEEV